MIYFKPETFETLKPFIYPELKRITRQEFVNAIYEAINFYADKVQEVLSLKTK